MSPEQNEVVNPSTVGPDFPGVTGSPAEGNRDMDRVAEEGLDEDDDTTDDDE